MPSTDKVYKSATNNNSLRAPVYVGVSYVIMMDVVQDNTQTVEFQLNTANDFMVTMGEFASKWEEVEGVTVKSQIDAHMAPKYV